MSERDETGISPELLRKHEVAKTIGVSVRTLEKMIARGDFPKSIRISDACYRWPRSTIMEWIETKKRAG